MTEDDIIAAIATAPGYSAIGIIRISGPRLDALVTELIGTPLPPRQAVFCSFRDEGGRAIDQGLALFFEAPHSYTGEDVLELQGHGGPMVQQQLLKRCLGLGARLAGPGEFTRRAYLNDKLDLAQAESVADLITAATTEAAQGAMRSLQGAFSQAVNRLVQELIELRTLVEATLDFPEEEIDFLKQEDARARLIAIMAQMSELLSVSQQGSLLREGIHVVLAGRPNVGKSSLLNRLAGEELAIVTAIPGTTRDAIRQTINIDGVAAHIIDTAGLRPSADAVEQIGIERAWAAIEKADVIVLLSDATQGEIDADRDILKKLPSQLPCIRVMNKIDLLADFAAIPRREGPSRVWLSAKTGSGIDLLKRVLLEKVGWQGGGEGLFMARERHVQALIQAGLHLENAAQGTRHLELLAEELRLAQESVASITGEFTSDDLLGEIFGRFCIGK